MKTILLVTLALFTASSGALAQTGPMAAKMNKAIESRFASADADHDGKLTKAEAQAGMPRVATHFDEIDTEKQGVVTLDQIKKFAANKKM